MFSKWAILITWAVISACDCFYVESLSKCSSNDEQCLKESISKILKLSSESGVKEINVPALDPLILKNIGFSKMNILNMTLEEAQLKGIKDCVVNSIHNDFAKGETNLEVTCDVELEGKFSVSETNPLFQSFLGSNAITIDGNVKLQLEKLHINMQFFYHFIKKDDGNIYFKCHIDEFHPEYDIGNAKLSADKILLGGKDDTENIVGLFNQNWKYIWQTFGKSIVDVVVPIFNDILHRFLDTVPAKSYFSDDLTPYVKNV
ncbi:uncharacterized protein LOC126772243 [Nymphalis io]|uniref:uncharacterized protein LOC126772243 n=1 Tax=Inachis io TaxID=171585 RepID=UPI0021679CB3|nr:uncharacterized protein LOC126772243 [Nymphalis io]